MKNASSNKKFNKYIAIRRIVLKLRAIQYKGGKCVKCGYDKCYAAMDFHHRDPAQKEFNLRQMVRIEWNKVLLELDKCDLLCATCHREQHYDQDLYEKAVLSISKPVNRPINLEEKIIGTCATCGCQYNKNLSKQKYCSYECAQKAREMTIWPENLEFLVNSSSKLAVAKMLGVSDKAVAKRLKKH